MKNSMNPPIRTKLFRLFFAISVWNVSPAIAVDALLIGRQFVWAYKGSKRLERDLGRFFLFCVVEFEEFLVGEVSEHAGDDIVGELEP